MNPVVAFVVVMAVWTVSEMVAKRTRSLLSSLFVASIIFLIGFLTGIFPEDLLQASSLLALAGVVVGFVIVHLGTMISLDDFKKQWRTLLVGISAVAGMGVLLLGAAYLFGGDVTDAEYDGLLASARDFALAGTGALSGGTISVLIVQEAALGVGLTAVAVFPVLIAALQGLIGFPLTSIILRKEATRLRDAYRAGDVQAPVVAEAQEASAGRLPAFLRNTPGTLFIVGVVVLLSIGINNLTDGTLNTFVMALIFGIVLRSTGVFKANILNGIDSFGLMMLAIMILVFGPLATVEPADVAALAVPLLVTFVVGLAGMALFTVIVGRLLGYSPAMSLAIGLTSLYGFPGTMILSQEAARGAGEDDEERAAIEGQILPKMIVAGFSTVTITSVVVTSIIAGGIGG
ncbi:hypothetical protein [Demequina silvatica]|uniref:hypothetical protein n=1 Tax=Demequina silvatica TaxID=1638988 RepID=UPI0007833801|nr:hypothetical protein [Demequina silvatica]